MNIQAKAIFGFALCGLFFFGGLIVMAASGLGLLPPSSSTGLATLSLLFSAFICAALGCRAMDESESINNAVLITRDRDSARLGGPQV